MALPTSTLIIATHNAHKTEEVGEMLAGCGFDSIIDLRSFPGIPPAVEDGQTFEDNATIKALAASRALPEAMILADDSGIEVDALDRRPGVRSARFAGETATDADNRKKLLSDLNALGTRGKDRSARFRCVLALAREGKLIACFEGSVEGIVANEEKGEGGFGYDPLFIPEDHCETFGQLPPEVKQALSHRAQAVAEFKRWIEIERSFER